MPADATTGADRRRPVPATAVRPARGPLTGRVFGDLALAMIALGVLVGLALPSFAVRLGVPAVFTDRLPFRGACLAAGFLLSLSNIALARFVVGRRLTRLSDRLRLVAGDALRARPPGAWAASQRLVVDSRDELGATATAFNRLLEVLDEAEHARAIVRHASDVITVVDGAATISYQTPSVEGLLGHVPGSLLQTDLAELVHPDDRRAFRDFVVALFAVGGPVPPLQVRLRHRDGSWRWTETVGRDSLDEPDLTGLVLTTRDVTERRVLEERRRVDAFEDRLTGLPNRARFLELLGAAEADHVATGVDVALLFCDLDDLKAVNDVHGHNGGDVVLRTMAERFVAGVRPGVLVARLSGDEFAVLFTGVGSAQEAAITGQRLLDVLREPVHVDGVDVRVGVSAGLATSDTCTRVHVTLSKAADVALHAAKAGGKGRLEVFEPRHHAARLAEEQLRADLHGALAADQLSVVYQPIVELPSGRTRGFEALLRWQHPERGPVSPATFIPLAEESGLVVPIGEWVLRQACRQAAGWLRRDPSRSLRMSVNVSARQFQHPTLVASVAAVLAESGLPAHALTLEITETLLVADAAATARTMSELKALGVRIALDDFGTGYSSLSYLRRFPIDVLKVDKAFVDDLETSAEDRAVTGAILALSETLSLEVVAEGIETVGQAEALLRLGCVLGQGYLFSRPVPADAAQALIDADRPLDADRVPVSR